MRRFRQTTTTVGCGTAEAYTLSRAYTPKRLRLKDRYRKKKVELFDQARESDELTDDEASLSELHELAEEVPSEEAAR